MTGEHFDTGRDPSRTPRDQRVRASILGVHFACCSVYARVYVNQQCTHYVGHCPRAGGGSSFASAGRHGTTASSLCIESSRVQVPSATSGEIPQGLACSISKFTVHAMCCETETVPAAGDVFYSALVAQGAQVIRKTTLRRRGKDAGRIARLVAVAGADITRGRCTGRE